MSEDIKVVINLTHGKGSIGVQAPNCDPVMRTVDGGLEAALKMVPVLVEEARKKWAVNARNPKADLPAPPPQPQVQKQANTPPKQPTSPQPKMF
jgi:hypothetical protein